MRGQKLSLIALAFLFSTSVAAQPDRLLLELFVNGSAYGTAFVLVRNQHIFVDEDALKRADLPLDHAHEEIIDTRRFVDLSSYDRGSKVQLDPQHGRLLVTLPAQAFATHQLGLVSYPALTTPQAVPSLYVNYALNVGTLRYAESAYFDAGFAYGKGLLRDNPSWSRLQGFSRGLTRFEYDDTAHLRRWTIGDQYAYSSDGLGGAALLGGAGVVRAFDLDPYLITFPQPTLAGLLQAPGTVDIYKNGVLVGQRQVAAGPFDLGNLGLGPGTNDVKVVIHDPFGGTRILQQTFYGTNQSLAQGLSEYAFQAGIERTSTLANGYMGGEGVLLARQRYGFTNWLTAGYRIEAQNGLVNAGPSVDLRLPIGSISAGVAGSRARGHTGSGATVGYQFVGRHFSFGFGAQSFSAAYRRLGDNVSPTEFRLRRVNYVNASWSPVSRFSLQLNAGDLVYASGSRQRNIGINGNFSLPGNMMLMLGLNRQINHPGDNDKQAMLNLVIPMGSSSIGFNAGHDDHTGQSYGVSAQRSVPSGNGWGYNVDAQHDATGVDGRGELDYQGSYGLVSLTGQRFAGQSSGNLLVSGSLTALGGHVYAGRTVQNGYALVETDGVPGVVVTRENLPVGKTDANGNLLVTNLLPFQANKVGIDQNSVPLQDQIDATDEVVSVPRLGGAIVRFGVHALHAARGTLTFDGKPLKYGSATLVSDGRTVKTLIGLDGAFYYPDLPAGHYRLDAITTQGSMQCTIVMPAGNLPLTDLGKVSCTATETKP